MLKNNSHFSTYPDRISAGIKPGVVNIKNEQFDIQNIIIIYISHRALKIVYVTVSQ